MSVVIQNANILRNSYRYEIDGKIDANAFFKAKLKNDIKNMIKFTKNLNKKIK